MNDMTLPINHDVSVVPILNLKDVARHRVCGHTFDKVHLGLLEGRRSDLAVFSDKEAQEVVHDVSSHFVSRGGIWNDVDHSTLSQRPPQT